MGAEQARKKADGMGKSPGGDTKGARVQGRGAGGPWTVDKGALTYMNKTDTPESGGSNMEKIYG